MDATIRNGGVSGHFGPRGKSGPLPLKSLEAHPLLVTQSHYSYSYSQSPHGFQRYRTIPSLIRGITNNVGVAEGYR